MALELCTGVKFKISQILLKNSQILLKNSQILLKNIPLVIRIPKMYREPIYDFRFLSYGQKDQRSNFRSTEVENEKMVRFRWKMVIKCSAYRHISTKK